MSDSLVGVVDTALRAAWSGALPPLVDELVDREQCARLTNGSFLCFTFRVPAEAGGAELPRVRVAAMEDDGAMRARVLTKWPEAQAWLERWPDAQVKYELDGSGKLRLLFFQIDLPEAPGVPADERIVGAMVELPGGVVDAYTMHEAPPYSKLTPHVRAQAKAAWDAGARGMWFCRWKEGQAHALSLSAENPYTRKTVAIIQGLGGGAGLLGTKAAFELAGLEIHPWGAEWMEDGAVEITFWSVREGAQTDASTPDIFKAGEAPDAEAFAAAFVPYVFPHEGEEARRLVRDHLHPALLATSGNVDPADHFKAAWSTIFERLANDLPFARIDTLRAVSASAHLFATEATAFHLALQRYVLSHPDLYQADTSALPDDVRALDAEGVQARAEALLPTVRELAGLIAGVPDLPLRQLADMVPTPEATIDSLERAISGDFTAAAGRMHEWLQQIGPGGYDDDPSLAALDDVDMEAESSRTAIEEALAAVPEGE